MSRRGATRDALVFVIAFSVAFAVAWSLETAPRDGALVDPGVPAIEPEPGVGEPIGDTRAGAEPPIAQNGERSDAPEPEPELVRIVGRVTDDRGGDVAGATIVATGDAGEAAVGTSGLDGTYEALVSAAARNVRARHRRTVSFAIGPLEGRFEEGERVDLVLLFDGRDVTIEVRDDTGEPVAGATVIVGTRADDSIHRELTDAEAAARYSHRRGTTGAEGRVALHDLAPIELDVFVRAEGYQAARATIEAGDAPGHARVTVTAAARVSGRIESDGPLAAGQFAVRTLSGYIGIANPDGAYELKALPPGPQRLMLVRFGTSEPVLAALDVELRPGDDIVWNPTAPKQAKILGVVVDLDSRPLARFHVIGRAAGGEVVLAFTAEDGAFSMTVRDGIELDLSARSRLGGLEHRGPRVAAGTTGIRLKCDPEEGMIVRPVDASAFGDLGAVFLGAVPIQVHSATVRLDGPTYVIGQSGVHAGPATRRLPFGTYMLFLVSNESHGVMPIGEHVINSTNVEVGAPIRLPAPGRLVVRGSREKAFLTYETKTPVTWMKWIATNQEVRLLPGSYVVTSGPGGASEAKRVAILSGETSQVELD